MIDYKNFKINANNLRTLASQLLKELDGLADTNRVNIITYDLSYNKKIQRNTVAQVKAGLNNPKMTDIIISGCEMQIDKGVYFDFDKNEWIGFDK